MKRRAFFGLMGGAAVAGPQVAKAALAEMPAGLGHSFGGSSPSVSYDSEASSIGGSNWKLKEIADLKRVLTGELTAGEKEQRKRDRLYQQERVISQSVASLVSVSGVRKLDIFRERMEQHQEKIRISHAQGRLHWLLREDE